MGYQRDLYRLAADTDRSADGTLAALFDLGCDRFDLEFGGLARIDPDTDSFELEATSGDHDHLRPGATVPLSETYCRELASGDDTAAVADPDAAGLTDTVAYETFGVRSYVGTRVRVPNDADRSLFFVSTDHRPGGFSAADQTFLDLMGQLVGYELERDERERNLRHLYEITANRDASFQQKVEAVLSFGCERFGLERGYLVDVCPDDEGVEIEHAVGRGEPPRDRPTAGSGADQFTRRTIQLDCPIGVTDTHSLVCDADPIYDESDYRTYFGVTVTGDDGPYGTLAFCDRDARTRPFSTAEYTFLELLGQWVSHELVQRRRENQLAALNDMSRDLMSTATRAEIVTRTIDHAGESLHLPVSAIVEYDGDRGTLRPVAQTPRAESALPIASLCDRTDGPLWEAFVAGEATLVEDVTGNTDGSTDVTEVLAVPLDRERLFVSGTTAPTGLSAADRDFLAATAATVEAACARADREQELRTREETLELQNDVLERLNRVNDIIRNIDQALVGATSRGEIEAVVCEQLAGVGPYELAWVGDRDGADGSVTPKEWAGAKRDSISALRHEPTADGDACDVARRVAETGEPHVVNDVLEDGPVTPWHQTALNRGYHACIGLPLSYEESFYGVLVVYAGRPGVFDDLEQSVLAELTDTIAYAVNAVESKKAIVSDEVTTLDFDLADAELGVVEVAREFRCDVALENLVPGADGTFLAFISTRGAPPEDLYEASAHLPLEDLTLVATHDDGEDPFGLFEVALPDGCLFTTVLEHGGRPCSFEITDGRPRLSVELAADASVREFVEMFQAAFPGAELFAQRTRERPQQSATEFFAGLTDALTDRQLETLQMAYYSGYLNEPRRQRATDVADAMGISQPTFNSHLRAAQRRLCEQLFDEHAPAT